MLDAFLRATFLPCFAAVGEFDEAPRKNGTAGPNGGAGIAVDEAEGLIESGCESTGARGEPIATGAASRVGLEKAT